MGVLLANSRTRPPITKRCILSVFAFRHARSFRDSLQGSSATGQESIEPFQYWHFPRNPPFPQGQISVPPQRFAGSMRYLQTAMLRFSQLCESVAAASKKTEKVALVAGYLRNSSREDAALGALYLSGQVFPRREERV